MCKAHQSTFGRDVGSLPIVGPAVFPSSSATTRDRSSAEKSISDREPNHKSQCPSTDFRCFPKPYTLLPQPVQHNPHRCPMRRTSALRVNPGQGLERVFQFRSFGAAFGLLGLGWRLYTSIQSIHIRACIEAYVANVIMDLCMYM